jgi:SAM-dependent methyltransferase
MEEFGDTPLERFIETLTGTVPGLEFVDAVKTIDPRSEVLDIGVGFGQSSMYLSSRGFRVTAVEPSANYCSFIEHFSNTFDLNIEIHECPIEVFQSKNKFDACVFNASFHHCPNPDLVAAKCFDLLKDNGKLLLINENILKFYHSKKWFYSTLKKNPGRLGHYGGNEHVYRHREYVAMLRRNGFGRPVEKIPVFYKDLRTVFRINIDQKVNRRFQYDERGLIARFLWYFGMSKIVGNPLLAGVAKRLSLILCTYIGIKKAR